MIILLSTELCVLGVFAAAAIVAYCVRPAHRGPVTQHFLPGTLGDTPVTPGMPWLEVTVEPDMSVIIIRRGLDSVDLDGGAVNLSMTISDFNIDIRERRITGYGTSTPATTARFTADFLAAEHYRITYRRDQEEITLVFTINIRPGIHRIFY